MKLSNKEDRYKVLDELETGPHCTVYLELHALDCWHSLVSDRCPLGYLFVNICKCQLENESMVFGGSGIPLTS